MNIFRPAFHKYVSLSRQKKSAIWYMCCTVLQKGIAFITVPLFSRLLTENQYGMSSVYSSWSQVTNIIILLGVDHCTNVGLSKFPDRRGFLSSIQALMTVLCLFSAGICVAFGSKLSVRMGLSEIVTLCLPFVALFSRIAANWSWYHRFEYRYKQVVALTLTYALLSPILSVIAISFAEPEKKGLYFVLAQAISTVLIYAPIYIRVFWEGRAFYRRQYWKFALLYSIPCIPHLLSQVALTTSDRIMIDKLCSREEAAYYGVAYSGANLINLLMWSLAGTLIPWLFDSMKREQYNAIYKKIGQILLVVSLLPLSMPLFAPEILTLLAPPSYSGAIWIVPSVACSAFFNFLYVIFSNIEFYFAKTIYASIATTVGACLNLALNWLLLPALGFVAAGYTTLIGYIVMAALHLFFASKMTKKYLSVSISSIMNLKLIGFASCFLTLSSVLISFSYPFPAVRYSLIAACLCAIFISRRRLIRYLRKALSR